MIRPMKGRPSARIRGRIDEAKGGSGGAVFLPQPWAVDLAVGIARQRPAVLDDAGRHHVGGQAAAAFGKQRGRVERRAAIAAGDDVDGGAQRGVGHAEGAALADQAGGIQRFFHFGGADAVAGGLDHLVQPADEVEVALGVLLHRVAGEHGVFGQRLAMAAAAGADGQGAEAFGGFFRIVPVALGDEGAAMHQFARLVGGTGRAVGTQHQNLGVGDGLADGVGSHVGLGRRQVGGAEGFGQAVHEEGLHVRQAGAQHLQRLAGHAAAGVGDVAQLAVEALAQVVGPGQLGELDVERRHGGEAGDGFGIQRFEHVARHQVIEQHDAGAGVEGGGELAEAGIEGERQGGEQAVVSAVLEVAGDAAGAHHHVAVGEHHALGAAGAAGGVEDRRHVAVDDAVRGPRRRGQQGVPGQAREVRRQHVAGRRIAGDDQGMQVGALGQGRQQAGEPLRRGEQHPHIAVGEDVAHLLGLEDRVHRHEDQARRAGAEGGDHRLEALFQIDAHPLAALQAKAQQAVGAAPDGVTQLAIVQGRGTVGEGAGIWRALRREQRQFVEQGGSHGRDCSGGVGAGISGAGANGATPCHSSGGRQRRARAGCVD